MLAFISTYLTPPGMFSVFFYDANDYFQYQVFMRVNDRLKCEAFFKQMGVTAVDFSDKLPDEVLVMVKYLEKFNT